MADPSRQRGGGHHRGAAQVDAGVREPMRPLKLRFVAEMPVSPASSRPSPRPMHGPQPGGSAIAPASSRSPRPRSPPPAPGSPGSPPPCRRTRPAPPLAAQHRRRGLQVLEPPVHARQQVGFLDLDLLRPHLPRRPASLHGVGARHHGRHLGQVQRDTAGVVRVGIRARRAGTPGEELGVGDAMVVRRPPVAPCARAGTSRSARPRGTSRSGPPTRWSCWPRSCARPCPATPRPGPRTPPRRSAPRPDRTGRTGSGSRPCR
jgi:hypothetical protein